MKYLVMMKYNKIWALTLLLICSGIVGAQVETAYYDDVYFDGEITKPKVRKTDSDQQLNNQEDYDALDEDFISTEEKNDYAIDEDLEPYDYEYSSRVRRFHNSAPGFSYYSNYYVDNYWYCNNDPYYYGSSIYTSPNYGYYNGWGNNYYSGWRNHYNYYNQGWGNNYNYGWGNNFNNGWGNNYWNNGYRNYFGLYNNYSYWNNNYYWDNFYGNNNFWAYNFNSATPNSTQYVILNRTRRGSDTNRRTGHTSQSPTGTRTTSFTTRRMQVNTPNYNQQIDREKSDRNVQNNSRTYNSRTYSNNTFNERNPNRGQQNTRTYNNSGRSSEWGRSSSPSNNSSRSESSSGWSSQERSNSNNRSQSSGSSRSSNTGRRPR